MDDNEVNTLKIEIEDYQSKLSSAERSNKRIEMKLKKEI